MSLINLGGLPRLIRRGLGSDGNERKGSPRRLVVGDIHGCSQTFRALCMEELAVTPADHLYLLGDLVSKGPDSIGVLEFVDQLMREGVAVTIVRGNHEAAILRATKAGKGALRRMLEQTNNTALLDRNNAKRLDPRWLRLFAESRLVVPLERAILVHGGIDFSAKEPFSDGKDLVQRRETIYDADAAEGKIVIHGHTRTSLPTIIERLVTGHPVLPLDNGAVGASNKKPYKISEYGNLCCYELGAHVLHIQPNRDVAAPDGDEPLYSVQVRAYRRHESSPPA